MNSIHSACNMPWFLLTALHPPHCLLLEVRKLGFYAFFNKVQGQCQLNEVQSVAEKRMWLRHEVQCVTSSPCVSPTWTHARAHTHQCRACKGPSLLFYWPVALPMCFNPFDHCFSNCAHQWAFMNPNAHVRRGKRIPFTDAASVASQLHFACRHGVIRTLLAVSKCLASQKYFAIGLI